MNASTFLVGSKLCVPRLATRTTGERPKPVPAAARLETPARGDDSTDAEGYDAFQELVNLSKKQSVNRPQDVSRARSAVSCPVDGMHIWRIVAKRTGSIEQARAQNTQLGQF